MGPRVIVRIPRKHIRWETCFFGIKAAVEKLRFLAEDVRGAVQAHKCDVSAHVAVPWRGVAWCEVQHVERGDQLVCNVVSDVRAVAHITVYKRMQAISFLQEYSLPNPRNILPKIELLILTTSIFATTTTTPSIATVAAAAIILLGLVIIYVSFFNVC